VISLLAEGVEFVAATDHNHVTDLAPAIEELGVSGLLGATAGVEITTPSWGHFNAFPYPADAAPPPFMKVTPAAIFARVREVAPAAVIQVNHPRMKGCGYFTTAELDTKNHVSIEDADAFSFDFDTLEVINGLELDPQVVERNLHDFFDLLDLGKRYTAVGNSDSHRLVWQWAGYPRTYVRVPDDRPGVVTAEQVASSLLGGHAVVSNGPFIVALADGRAGPGDFVMTRTGQVMLELSVRAPDWMDVRRVEVWMNGKRVVNEPARVTSDVIRFEGRSKLKLDRDAWIVVVARGDKAMLSVMPGTNVKPFAFTNPIFVDTDGDGVFRGRRAN
jgi:hypothetical protein